MRDRFFFMPIWVFGLAIICYHLGWPGRIVFVALLVGGIIWLFLAAKKQEVVDWRKAQEEFVKSAAPPANADEIKFWEWVKATLFLPTWMDFTPEVCQHD